MKNNNSHVRHDRVYIDSMAIADGKASVDEFGILRGVCPVTRCGVFLYLNSDGSERRELRPKEEVFSPSTINSLKLIPITLNHPQEGYVDSSIAVREAIGSTGETIKESGDYVYSSIVVFDKDAIEAITTKRICELSLGYTSEIENVSGEYNGEPFDCIQRNIVYNHLSVVERGRAGSDVRIKTDALGECMHKDEQEIPRDNQIKAPIKPQTLNEQFDTQIKRMDSRIDSIEAALDSLSKKIEKMMENKEDMEEEEIIEDACSRDETEEQKRKRKLKESQEMESREDAMHQAIQIEAAKRAKYLMAASNFLSKDKFAGIMDKKTEEIRDSVLGLYTHQDSFAGKSKDYLDAMFDIYVGQEKEKTAPKVNTITDILQKNDSKKEFLIASEIPMASLNVKRD